MRQKSKVKMWKFDVFSHDHNFFLFEVQTWPTYEKYSIFHGDSKKQHRVTPKRNKCNKNNTLSQASLDWPNISKIEVVYSFTKLVQEHFRHHIYIENQQTKSISKFCSIYFFDMTLQNCFSKVVFLWIFAFLKAFWGQKWPKLHQNVFCGFWLK